MKGVEKIMEEKPDLILFTATWSTIVPDEMENYMDVFNRLNAPLGVYSTLGNHDYGDYVQWNSTRRKKSANLEEVEAGSMVTLGWRLLMNEHVVLEKGEDKIALMGVENWSAKARFPKYGNMEKAYAGSEAISF